ncbi:MAG TPA: flagellar basal body L-ring protein FlgH [Thiobacillaceae bacterium]|nr:flagellar basal body L-ring protein FlgH [Thiobacillaceae bacterium]
MSKTIIAQLLLIGSLAGCSVAPSTDIKQPLTAKPKPPVSATENNGAIFQPNKAVRLFEDRRARQVGDTLTVNLVENTSATRKSETTETREASADINVPTPTVLGRTPPGILAGDTTWNPESDSTQTYKDNETNSNTFKGSITVTVTEVLDNGNLVVAGEKRIAINNDSEYLRLAGVVNPAYITSANTVNSTQLADVQLESKNSQGIDKSQLSSMLARFFLILMPF